MAGMSYRCQPRLSPPSGLHKPGKWPMGAFAGKVTWIHAGRSVMQVTALGAKNGQFGDSGQMPRNFGLGDDPQPIF